MYPPCNHGLERVCPPKANYNVSLHCRLCYLHDLGLLPAVADGKSPPSPRACTHLGRRVRTEAGAVKQVLCTSGCASGTLLDLFHCRLLGEITQKVCGTCADYTPSSALEKDLPSDGAATSS